MLQKKIIFHTGSPHQLITLNGLVAKLSGEINEIRPEILKKEDQFQDLVKHMTRVLCDYDKETRDIIETLHRTRDEQVIYTNSIKSLGFQIKKDKYI